jgi:hypothetical protein
MIFRVLLSFSSSDISEVESQTYDVGWHMPEDVLLLVKRPDPSVSDIGIPRSNLYKHRE